MLQKDERVFDVLQIDQAAEHLELGAPIHFVINLVDRRHVHGRRFDAHALGIAREVLDELLDRLRQRRREEDRLPLRRRLLEDRLDVFAKAHVEHAIGLIEDDHLDRVELQRPALKVIHHAAGRADDDLRAVLQAAKLALVALPAVDRQLADAALEKGELGDFFRDLHGQFARGAEDQHLRGAQIAIHLLDRRDGEGRGFSRARLRLPDDIVSSEQDRDGGGLNRRGLLVTDPRDRFEQLRRKPSSEKSFFCMSAL